MYGLSYCVILKSIPSPKPRQPSASSVARGFPTRYATKPMFRVAADHLIVTRSARKSLLSSDCFTLLKGNLLPRLLLKSCWSSLRLWYRGGGRLSDWRAAMRSHMLIETVRRAWKKSAGVITRIHSSVPCRFAFSYRPTDLDIAVGAELLPLFQDGLVSAIMEVECC